MSTRGIKSLLAWFTRSSKKFSKPIKSDCVIFDQEGSDILNQVIPARIKRIVLHARRESIYLNPKTVVFLAYYACQGFSLDLAYYASQIRQVQPKVVLTYIDNKPAFHELSNIFLSIRFIAIQNGNRFPYVEGCLPPDTSYQSEILLWSDYERDLYADLGTTFMQVYVTGSLRNQLALKHRVQSLLSAEPGYDICFISTFDMDAGDSLWVEEGELIGLWLNDFLKSDDSLKVCVALRFGSDSKVKLAKEIEHFQKIFGNSVVLVPRDTPFSNYILTDISSVAVSAGSSLSIEALARGNRSLIFHPLRTTADSLKSECALRTYSTQKDEFKQRLYLILTTSDEEFAQKYADEIAYFSHHKDKSDVMSTLNDILWNSFETSM